MDLQAFGKTLSRLMDQARLTRPALAEKMHVSASLIDKWKSVSADEQRHRRPSYDQVVQLIRILAPQLTPAEARAWGMQAGYQVSDLDLAAIFSPVFLYPRPTPNLSLIYNRLEPLPTHKLFGVDTAKGKLSQALYREDDYWLLAIDGMGGIGKTALANVLVREMLERQRFHDVAWISAKQELFLPDSGLHSTQRPTLDPVSLFDTLLEQLDPTFSVAPPPQEKQIILMRWFKNSPYLVVIDNLETVQEYEAVIDPLRQLANPTKFLLTSRHSLSHYTDVYSHSLTELSKPDTLDFLRYQAETQDIPALVQATAEELAGIYQVVGGHPLALKLVIGQIRFMGLPEVLAKLQQAQGKTIDDLYRYIYRQIWNVLSEIARRVLIQTPLAEHGTRQDLSRLSQVSSDELDQVLKQLIMRSLVEVTGTLDQPRYRVHSLTKTFLHTEIFNRWKPI